MTAIPFGAKAAALAGDHGVLQAGAFRAVGQALLLTATSDGATSGVAVGCRSLAVNGKPRQVPVFTDTAAVTIATRTTDGAFTIRYAGHLEVPRDGVYTFDAPHELVYPDTMNSYDLGVFVDGEEWYPATRQHAQGTWSVPLARYPASGIVAVVLAACAACWAAPSPGKDASGTRRDFAVRASRIDPLAKEHPEIGFVFVDAKGGPMDVQHAVVDVGVPARGKLVIWLMDHSQPLFERIASYGLHGIQVHYANRWFGGLEPGIRDSGDTLGRIRLEAATGEDASPLVDIPKRDGMVERSRQFLLWLDAEHPEGRWAQFLTDDRRDLRWEQVTMAGISHGATTAARFAVHRPVDRVVMLSGPRDNTETWQGMPSATAANRFFGFTHVLDAGWTADHYCRSWQLLRMHEHGPVVDVDEAAPPYANTRRLVTAADVGMNPGRAHTAVLPGSSAVKNGAGEMLHEAVWRYLFTHPSDVTGAAVPPDADCATERQPTRGVPPSR